MDDATDAVRRMPGLEIPVCPRCAAENVPARTFCASCGGPLSVIATVGPFETAVMQGRAIGEAFGARRPTGIVVAGAWLLALACLGPAALVGASLLVAARPGAPTFADVPGLLVAAGFGGLVLLGAWRVTSRWRRSRGGSAGGGGDGPGAPA